MNTKKGFFIIADISGFTSFVAGSELEHSQHILNELLKHLIKKFTPVFTLAEVEGDAVFVYAPVDKFSRPEIILEVIENCYYSFRDNKATLKRLVTCNCKACEMVQTLDLKFIIHCGDYVLNEIAGKQKPMGTSVNVVHRLLKNKVSETTGWKSYILFSEECLKNVSFNFPDVHLQTESYEHLGEISTVSLNLDARYKEFVNDRVVFVSEKDADYHVERIYPITPSLLWEWVNNPIKRSQWLQASNWKPKERPSGRTGKGATNHCANSNFFEYLLDYRPFDYYTSEISRGKMKFRLTGKFVPNTDGTKFIWFIKISNNLPGMIKRLLGMFILNKALKVHSAFNKLDEFVNEEVHSNPEFISGSS